ncbi:MAG: dihydrolipoamide dehydrogenase [Flavobacteriaceae bacterium]|nr:MAG: dihydrolipoamide dehydrogenase [Flavobacteriaceae bacterium]
MKNLILFTFVALLSLSMEAQITTPAPSPSQKIEQAVGLTDVTVDYSRPAMRGRAIFGDLVPYDAVWRTGANARTKVSFSDDVVVDGQTLKAGTYAIFTKPSATSWEVYFYTEYDGGGAPQEWDESKVAAKTTAQVYDLPMDIQSFTISIDDITNTSAVLGLMWEKVYVGVQFEVPTDAAVMSSIESTMNGPGAFDYYAAAVYYLGEDKDINKAQEWINKAISMNDPAPFWMLRQQSLIYAKAGDKKGAIKIAKQSLTASEAANNADYVKMNKDSLKEWGAK